MIVDTSGRYLLAHSDGQLWNYDARWRSTKMIELEAEGTVFAAEGAGYLSLAETFGDITKVTVRSPARPEESLATGTFTEASWHFEGDPSLWASVPDYVIVPGDNDHPGILRVADGAEFDPLDGIGPIHQVIDVPESRLVLLISEGGMSVYDPVARSSVGRHDLAEQNKTPLARFRSSDEVWISDINTMLKLETKKFEPIDAAGSEAEGGADLSDGIGRFAGWTFAAGTELCVVTRPDMGDVLVLDAVSMLPVAQAVFTAGSPVDAALIRRNVIVGRTLNGRTLRGRARKVKSR